MDAITDDLVAPTDIDIDPCVDLHCGSRVRPSGDLVAPIALAGIPQTEICEQPARYLIGEPRIIESKEKGLDDGLELMTETRQRNQLAVLSCNLHTDRAIEYFEANSCNEDAGRPRISLLKNVQGE